MKKNLHSLFCIFILASCSESKLKLDCSKFRNGNFYYHEKITNTITDISRNDSVQIETSESTGLVMVERIKWQTPCRYELLLLSKDSKNVPKDSIEKKVEEIERTTPIITNIVSTGDDYYVFESRMDRVKAVLKDTIWLKK